MKPWLDDGDLRLYHGDVLDVLRGLPSGIAQTCVTSPPYWGLRDYSVDGQLGLEATPTIYVERMVAVFREVRRVLRDDGTLWLNIGDSYASGGSGPTGDASTLRGNGHVGGGPKVKARETVNRERPAELKPKDLVGIPWRLAFALQQDGWYLRSDIIWAKPNPMPESVTDRPTKAHEYVFLFSKQPRYFYDADAVREDGPTYIRKPGGYSEQGSGIGEGTGGQDGRRAIGFRDRTVETTGRNLRSVWQIATRPFPEAHFATYPEELVRRCILAGTSERGGCAECGAPWRRIAETTIDESRPPARRNIIPPQVTQAGQGTNANGSQTWGHWTRRDTLGWEPSCRCSGDIAGAKQNQPDGSSAGDRADTGCHGGVATLPAAIPQLVLDPFIGSGTTALVARKHGRRSLGIDLSQEYLELAAKRTRQLSLLGGC